jgi:hypothetical protein
VNVSIKERGKNLETKVMRSSRTAGQDVRKGLNRVGSKLSKTALKVGDDLERGGQRAGKAARRGVARVNSRLRPNRARKA